jgi:hypothetical protein
VPKSYPFFYFSSETVVKDLEFLKGVLKEMGTGYSKQQVCKYLPVGDAISFETLESDLLTIDSLANELIKFLAAKKLKPKTARKFSELIGEHVISEHFFCLGFNWGNLGEIPDEPNEQCKVLKNSNLSHLVFERK